MMAVYRHFLQAMSFYIIPKRSMYCNSSRPYRIVLFFFRPDPLRVSTMKIFGVCYETNLNAGNLNNHSSHLTASYV